MENQFDMKCPKCKSDTIDIAASVWVRLTPDGTSAEDADVHDHEWDDNSCAKCCSCYFIGKVRDFEEWPEEPDKEFENKCRESDFVLEQGCDRKENWDWVSKFNE